MASSLDNNKDLIKAVSNEVKQQFTGEGSGHDWWHIYRVWQMSRHLSKHYPKADSFTIELAALTHDMADHKLMDHPEEGEKEIENLLKKHDLSFATVDKVLHIVQNISFKGAKVEEKMGSLEGKIVQDADRLDAIGAIGVARTFAYGGSKHHELYNPEIPVEQQDNFEKYKRSTAPTINHFYEKLLLLKDRMNTEAAHSIARERHAFMEQFLERFYEEWEGRK